MQATDLGPMDVAITLIAPMLLSFSCLLYAHVHSGTRQHGDGRSYARLLFK
ncbi:MAG: hypothetical protein ACI8PT_003613 [Gammaproteobacteria bacterium]|jgi:hypothetical protein